MAGLLRERKTDLTAFFKILTTCPKDALIVNELSLFIHCLEQSECSQDNEIVQNTLTQTKSIVYKIFNQKDIDKKAIKPLTYALQFSPTLCNLLLEAFKKNYLVFFKLLEIIKPANNEYINYSIQVFLEKSEDNIKQAAIRTLGRLASHLEEQHISAILPTILTPLKTYNENIKGNEIYHGSLVEFAPYLKEQHINQILGALNSQKNLNYYAIFGTLSEIDPNLKEKFFDVIFSLLFSAVKNSNSSMQAAIHALSKFTSYLNTQHILQLFPLLIAKLEAPQNENSWFTIVTLGSLAPSLNEQQISQLLPLLIVALKDSKPDLPIAVSMAIHKLAPYLKTPHIDQLASELFTVLKDDNFKASGVVIRSLDTLAPYLGKQDIETSSSMPFINLDHLNKYIEAANSHPSFVNTKQLKKREIFYFFFNILKDSSNRTMRWVAVEILKKLIISLEEQEISEFISLWLNNLPDFDDEGQHLSLLSSDTIIPYLKEQQILQLISFLLVILKDTNNDKYLSAVTAFEGLIPHVHPKNIPIFICELLNILNEADFNDWQIQPLINKFELSKFPERLKQVIQFILSSFSERGSIIKLSSILKIFFLESHLPLMCENQQLLWFLPRDKDTPYAIDNLSIEEYKLCESAIKQIVKEEFSIETSSDFDLNRNSLEFQRSSSYLTKSSLFTAPPSANLSTSMPQVNTANSDNNNSKPNLSRFRMV